VTPRAAATPLVTAHPATTRGYALILLAACLWGSLGPVARIALAEGIAPLELGFWRAALAGAVYAAHATALGRVRIDRRDAPGILAFALIGVTLFFWSYFQAVATGGAALAAVLLYTAPAWVAVASALWLAERLTPPKMAALAVTLAGVALVAIGGGGEARLGAAAVAWGLAAGLAYAAYYLFGKWYFPRYPAPTIFMYTMPLGALALLPAVAFSPKSAVAWAVIAYLAVVPTYAAYLLYSHGLRRVEATRAATVATIEPVVAAALAFLVWGEALGVWGYAGAALVLAGVVLMTRAPAANALDAAA
jgi:drug/metabolite transporter, DME family